VVRYCDAPAQSPQRTYQVDGVALGLKPNELGGSVLGISGKCKRRHVKTAGSPLAGIRCSTPLAAGRAHQQEGVASGEDGGMPAAAGPPHYLPIAWREQGADISRIGCTVLIRTCVARSPPSVPCHG